MRFCLLTTRTAALRKDVANNAEDLKEEMALVSEKCGRCIVFLFN